MAFTNKTSLNIPLGTRILFHPPGTWDSGKDSGNYFGTLINVEEKPDIPLWQTEYTLSLHVLGTTKISCTTLFLEHIIGIDGVSTLEWLKAKGFIDSDFAKYDIGSTVWTNPNFSYSSDCRGFDRIKRQNKSPLRVHRIHTDRYGKVLYLLTDPSEADGMVFAMPEVALYVKEEVNAHSNK